MRRKFGNSLLCALVVGIAGCSQILPLEDAGAESQADFSGLSAPLDLRQFEVVSSGGGYRGVFLRLSRFPDSIETSHYSDPARIVVDIRGPTGAESPEETFPGGDSLVAKVRLLREIGLLRVVLDLAGSDPPKYTVHRMADWIMIRLPPET
jgi:hypothetical protein